MKKLISHFTLFQATLFIVLFTTFAGAVIAWSGPSASAPNNNVDAPINVGSATQVKNGPLGVSSLAAYDTAQVGNLQFFGVGGDSGQGYNPYGIYQEAGSWTHPYPDLHIGYHTGISYEAYYNYGGHRFFTGYNGSGPTGLMFQVSDAVYSYGNLYAPAFLYSSDVSLKKDISTLSDSLTKVQALRGVSFTWKDTNKKSIGLIAQEVEKVLPELVATNPNTGLKAVEYGNLVGLLIEAVKEQQKEIESLKQRIDALE